MLGVAVQPASWLAGALAGLVIASSAAEPPSLKEQVEVSRVLLDVRVLGRGGEPVPGLTPDDFRVRVDGLPTRVEAADWVGHGGPGTAVSREPRLLVLFFQRHVESSRTLGLMRLAPMVARLVEGLAPEDWVAVATFDSHLELYTDFTRDHARVADIVRRHVMLVEHPGIPARGAGPSLVARLEPRAMRKAYSVETALRLLAVALEPMEGAKSVAYFCTGMGRLTENGVLSHRDFAPALQALLRGRTAVFSMDLVQADLHSLEEPLRLLAESTGGFYDKTYVLPAGDVHRLASALDGHYVLAVESPVPRRGGHRVDVRLAHGLHGTVHARDFFLD